VTDHPILKTNTVLENQIPGCAPDRWILAYSMAHELVAQTVLDRQKIGPRRLQNWSKESKPPLAASKLADKYSTSMHLSGCVVCGAGTLPTAAELAFPTRSKPKPPCEDFHDAHRFCENLLE